LRAAAIILLGGATAAMLALSMLTNATFGYRFGTTAMTAAVFAAANVVADIWKGLGLIVIAGLLRERHRTIAVLLIMLWIAALSFGVASSMGVYVQDRAAMVGGREVLQAALRDVEDELAEEEKKQRHGGVAGDVKQIEAAIEAGFAKPVMIAERVRGTVGSVSARCSRADARTRIATPSRSCARSSQARRQRTEGARALRSCVPRRVSCGNAAPLLPPILWPSSSLG
jgi:hypothetical protein